MTTPVNIVPSEPISGHTAPAPTLSGKPGYITYSNPPFHPNILNIGGGNSAVNPANYLDYNPTGSFRRGLIVGGAGVTPSANKGAQYRVNFLYNPSTITESRTLDINNGVLPAYARNPDAPGQYATGLNTSIGFSLLFDRTYELWDRNYSATLAGLYGVRADVEAFFNLLGINTPNTKSSSTPSPTINQSTIVVQGPMIMSPVKVFFGINSVGALSYFGFIQQIDITYTHFTAKMVPARCAVNVNFVAMPDVANSLTTNNL